MPSPVEALPWGSRSTISTRSPIAASAVPRLIAVVVLPTPPFWLAMARTRTGIGAVGLGSTGNWRISPEVLSSMAHSSPSRVAGAATERAYHHDTAGRMSPAGHEIGLDVPIFSGFGQFRINILALEQQSFCT